MNVWLVTRLWTYENEFPRMEQYAVDSEEKALIKAQLLLANDKKIDHGFWKSKDLITNGSIDKQHLEAFLDGQINTTYVSYSISQVEVK